jgi:hypothetical protein
MGRRPLATSELVALNGAQHDSYWPHSLGGAILPTRPGINPNFELNTFTMAERQAIMRLGQHFYITRAARPTQIGNSDYRAFLMRPTEEMSTALNVEREIIVLFADYETFEARTLQAFNKINEQFDDIRVDRSLRILISADSNIQNIIRHYLLQDPEYPIVVPLKFSDFRSPSEDFIYNAIRQNYLIRDLFEYQSPLRQEYFFFGRRKLVDNVIDLHKSGQNSSLFGLRKSGKTSTIFAIQRRAKTSGCRTILIDCQDPAIHARRYGALLQWIVLEVRKELNLRKIEIDLGSTPDRISETFRRTMHDALDAAGVGVLLIFDEIENISPQTAASSHWRDDNDSLLFWQTARSYFQGQQKNRLTFCFVGTNPHLFETTKLNNVDNPVYLFAPKTFIPMLSLTETTEMVSRLSFFMGLDFSPVVISYLHQRFGGHPFFIRQLCSQINKRAATARPREISLITCKEAELSASADLQRYILEILDTLKLFYPDEFTMIEYLAAGDRVRFHEMADYDSAYVEHLVGYGLIVRRGSDFEFSFEAVGEAVKRMLVKPISNSLSDRRIIVTRRRNVIEEEIRRAMYQWSMRLDANGWMQAWEQNMTQKRRDALGALSRQEAFSRNRSRLNFIELLQFIKFSNDYGSGFASIESISSAFNIVNKFRIDAHAGAIDDREYEELDRSLNLLEEIFVQPS